MWSVGVLEKAVLRWRRKRKGFRGLQIEIKEPAADHRQESDTEEDFYRASRKQAEERIEKAVVRVQAMFRSRRTQQEYRRMKLTHNQAQVGNRYPISLFVQHDLIWILLQQDLGIVKGSCS